MIANHSSSMKIAGSYSAYCEPSEGIWIQGALGQQKPPIKEKHQEMQGGSTRADGGQTGNQRQEG